MIEKVINVKAKSSLQPPSGTREIDSRCLKSNELSIKKAKIIQIWKTRMETKTKPSFIISYLLIVSLKLITPKKTNVIEAIKKTI